MSLQVFTANCPTWVPVLLKLPIILLKHWWRFMQKLFLADTLQTAVAACALPQLSPVTPTWKHRLSVLDHIDCMKEQMNGPFGIS